MKELIEPYRARSPARLETELEQLQVVDTVNR